MSKSKYCYLIDYGHGGLIDNKYQTAGKRSPKFIDRTFEDGSPFVLYEGVNNRQNGRRLLNELKRLNIDAIDIVNSEEDISLSERVRIANSIGAKKKCIYISIHSNAHGNGKEFTTAKGNSVHIYTIASNKSKRIADIMAEEFKSNFKDFTRWRGVKTNDFYVLRYTNMPAILLETGFMTNEEESKLMLSEEWKDLFIESVVNSIQLIEME